MKTCISAEEANERNSVAYGAQRIDVRSASEFAAGHVPGAVNIPLDELETRLGDISSERPVLLICQSGKRAAMAAELLEHCRSEIALLEGGTKAWAAAGLPLVRSVKSRWSLERQVRLIAGLLVVAGVVLALFVHPALIGLCGIVGLGLTFAGATDICAMGMLLAKLPWNRAARCPAVKNNEQTAAS
ncbi:MAG TPA: rhodanese-like domain-containing protein [Candidatus Acidoferrum sp.]|nr:rhodanese-like domain-containing protein [Candidatus Acidoferrum sp.]